MNKIFLNEGWLFKDADGERVKEFIPAEVPGTVHTDLLKNNLIPDPFFGCNETELQWIEEKDWVYKKEFSVNKEILGKKKINLVFKGIDTFADIYLNGDLLGSADNMFRPYVFDVGDILKEENLLEIKFRSPVKHLTGLQTKYSLVTHGPFGSFRSYGRKAQYSFGWDWGPRFSVSGLWKDVYLATYDNARIDSVYIKQLDVSKKNAKIEVQVEVDSLIKGDVALDFEIKGAKLKKTLKTHLIDGLNVVKAEFKIKNPELWYPNGYGEHYLYELGVSLKYKNKTVEEKKVRFGLRKIEILQEKDKEGRNFIFRINDMPVFCKGMNWVPADSFLTRVTRERCKKLLLMMKGAHMNMVRIWGGGIYENKEFYELCDELGIMVWQDFMSACQEVPDHLEWFRDSFRKEAVYQVKRLRNHPSIVVWCGNNENEGNRYDLSGKGKVKRYYGENIFYKILPEVCRFYEPTRPYVPSSPYSPDEYAYQSQNAGDFHSYEGWGGGDWRKFGDVKGRFIGETGCQSFPDIETIRKFATKEEQSIDSKTMLLHEKASAQAIELIKFGIENILGLKPRNFEEFVYFSQINWAEGSKFSAEHWRRRKFNTSGVLFWQLNDCWPVISWAFVDYYLRPKLCYFSVKRAFAPVLLSPVAEGNKVKIHLVNDTLSSFKGVMRIRLVDFKGHEFYKKEIKAKAAPNSNKIIFNMEIDVVNPQGQVLVMDLEKHEEPVCRNFLFFEKLGSLSLHKAGLNAEIKKSGKDSIKLILKSDSFAPAVKISADSDEAEYSDNYLFLMPGETKEIKISGAKKISSLDITGLNVAKKLSL